MGALVSAQRPHSVSSQRLMQRLGTQAKVEANLQKQGQLMEAIDRNQAAYKHAFGYREWRSACEVSAGLLAEL